MDPIECIEPAVNIIGPVVNSIGVDVETVIIIYT